MLKIEDYIKLLLEDPFKKQISMLDSYDANLARFQDSRPTELKDFKAHMQKLEKFKMGLESLKFDMTLDVIVAKITDDLAAEHDAWLSSQEKEYAAIDGQIEQLKLSIESENKSKNDGMISQNAVDNVSFETLESKRKILESYSDKIFDICSLYDIKTSEVNVDESMFTVDELDSLYDEYIKYMNKESGGSNPIRKFRELCSDKTVQGLVLGVILFLCYTTVLDILSIGFFALLIANQIGNINKAKYYSILMAITFNVKPENMGYVQLDESLLLPETITPEMMDVDERFSGFEPMYDEVAARYEETNPEKEQIRVMNEWGALLPQTTETLREYERVYNNKLHAILSDICSEIAYMKKLYEKAKSEWKFIGERFSEHYTFSGTFTLGLHDDCIEETVEIGDKNVIIRPSVDTTRMNKFLQALYVNAISNVWPGKLKVVVYDPNNFGRSLMPLFKNELSMYFEIINDDLNKVLDELTDYAQNNFKAMSGKTIAEFNKKAEDMGMTPIDYRLLIILSQPKTVEEDEKLQSFFEYSATGGVHIWVVSDNMQSKNAFVFRSPFEGVANPIEGMINEEWCSRVAFNQIDAINNAKPKGLPWRDFIDNVLPDDKMWLGNADNALNLYPGYMNGDPSIYKPYTLGNEGNVHGILVGGTGAGKSVCLNHLVATLCQEYSPNEIELWLCDFKGTEFQYYLPSAVNPYMLPHIKACLCTSDGDYATSLFKALRNQADERYEIIQRPEEFKSKLAYLGDGSIIPNQKGVVGWNRYWRKKAEETGDEKYLLNLFPRTLFICDEFQVIFEKASDKNLDSIRADITQIAKVGRAANVHIFFASQSMKKTLSADILQQFTLRIALRCDKDVSMEILNTTKASDIMEKFGFLIVKATGIADEDQPRYKTPFISDDGLREHIQNLAKKSELMSIPKKDVITYQESTKHYLTELEELYKTPGIQKNLPESGGVFFLGNRMAYSTNKAPDNIVLTSKNNSNIISCFTDYNDFVMFFNQMMCNIRNNKTQGTVIINSQVADLSRITDAADYITFPDKHGYLLSEKVSCLAVITWLEGLVDARRKANKKDTPIWVFLLGWDKGMGFGVDTDFNTRAKMNVLLQTCGEFHIHVIFILTGTNGLASATLNACNYLIAGKCSHDDSVTLLGTKQASVNYSMATGWLFSNHDGTITRDKLYISEVKHEIISSEIVL